jgi:hypothetical protein
MQNSKDVRWRGVGQGPTIPSGKVGGLSWSETGTQHVERTLREYRQARERAGNYVSSVTFSFYCENSDCAVNIFEVRVSHQFDPGYEVVHGFACPYCGKFAILNYYPPRGLAVENDRERISNEEAEARRSVWRQLQERRGQIGFNASEVQAEIDLEELLAKGVAVNK